jgi:hypothetical protein
MVKSLETGMKFLIPLSDGTFLPGYIVLDGNMFTLVNVFSNKESVRKEPLEFPEENILLRDWLIGDHVFSRSKKVIEIPWVMFRTKKVEEPLPPQIDGLIIGSRGTEHVVDLHSSKTLRRPPNQEDYANLPRHGIKSASFYSLAAEAKLLGKTVELKMPERKYVIV